MIKVSNIIEGVLTYINAFLLLDLTREIFAKRTMMAVIIVAIMSIIILVMQSISVARARASSESAVESGPSIQDHNDSRATPINVLHRSAQPFRYTVVV